MVGGIAEKVLLERLIKKMDDLEAKGLAPEQQLAELRRWMEQAKRAAEGGWL